MKYSPQTYAKAFAEVAARTPEEREEFVIKNFLALIAKNGDMRQIGKISVLAEKFLLKQSSRSKWTFESARPLKDARGLFNNLVGSTDVLEEKIISSVVAGVKIIKDGERQYDGSLACKLQKIFA